MLEDKQSYLSDLNEAQKKAVLKINGPSMVIAGAGSGKTRVLTYKIVHLIKNGIDPKITRRIWKAMIWSYVDFQRRNFKKK